MLCGLSFQALYEVACFRRRRAAHGRYNTMNNQPKKQPPSHKDNASNAPKNGSQHPLRKDGGRPRFNPALMEEAKRARTAKHRHQEEHRIATTHPERRSRRDHPRKLLPEVLTDWEQMLIAKHSPGTIESPFMQAMGVSTIQTGIVKS